MNRAARAALGEADVIVFVVEALRWTDEDERVLASCCEAAPPSILVVNKVDRCAERRGCCRSSAELDARARFAERRAVVGAASASNIERCSTTIVARLPRWRRRCSAEDEMTDRERALPAPPRSCARS